MNTRPRPMSPPPPIDPHIEIHLCVPDDLQHLLPGRRRAPEHLPLSAPIPRRGDVIYLSSSSAWGVELVIYEWLNPTELHVQLWLAYVGDARAKRPPGFSRTQ